MKVENAYLEDKFGNITGTVNTIKYNGKYGSYDLQKLEIILETLREKLISFKGEI